MGEKADGDDDPAIKKFLPLGCSSTREEWHVSGCIKDSVAITSRQTADVPAVTAIAMDAPAVPGVVFIANALPINGRRDSARLT